MGEVPRLLKLVVLASNTIDEDFQHKLRKQGLDIVGQGVVGKTKLAEFTRADVLIVELVSQLNSNDISAILEGSSIPVLLHEGRLAQQDLLSDDLLKKLHRLIGKPAAHAVALTEGAAKEDGLLVVVLCASVGGPKALRQFFDTLPKGLPVVFLLVQHMAEEFQDLLKKQVARLTDAPVALISAQQTLQSGEVWIVPADAEIAIEWRESQYIVRRLDSSWGTVNRPSIDAVLDMVASAYGVNCGAIIFSGIGYDGLSGCEAVVEQGGFVWAQTSESCVAPRLPDMVRELGHVEINGSPQELATALYKRCLTHHQASC